MQYKLLLWMVQKDEHTTTKGGSLLSGVILICVNSKVNLQCSRDKMTFSEMGRVRRNAGFKESWLILTMYSWI